MPNTQPLDYATRSALTLIEKKRVSNALSNVQARQLVTALVPEEAAGPQDASASEVFMQAIADVQKAQPQLSFVAASDQVVKMYPELHQHYLWEARHPGQPHPLTKQAEPAPTYEAVQKQVEERCADQPHLTKDEAWQALLKSVPEGSPAFRTLYTHYRHYHVSPEALRDRDAAADARSRV